eukprot:5734763-Pyramimonas_sp.AAC.1
MNPNLNFAGERPQSGGNSSTLSSMPSWVGRADCVDEKVPLFNTFSHNPGGSWSCCRHMHELFVRAVPGVLGQIYPRHASVVDASRIISTKGRSRTPNLTTPLSLLLGRRRDDGAGGRAETTSNVQVTTKSQLVLGAHGLATSVNGDLHERRAQ